MKSYIPTHLSVKRTLLAHLEHQPLIEQILLFHSRVREFLILVVLVDQVQIDCSRFP